MTSDDGAPDVPAAVRAAMVARTAYGRLLAILAAQDGDIEQAEDCLSDAFAQALQVWHERGVPTNPEAWLLTVARNRRRDLRRAMAHRLTDPLDTAVQRGTLPASDAPEVDAVPDRRLALLFVCAHPAIDPAVRTPLMLQTVLGVSADCIAHAFAIPPATMAQRLVRAKHRIRDARIPFVVPEPAQMPARLTPVLEAIYGAYAIDFSVVAGNMQRGTLSEEALRLAQTLAMLLPDEPEALGLLALLALSLARRAAREPDGEFVPLDEQDTARWDRTLIVLGERSLHHAQRLGRHGRFQIEAAIQSVHCARVTTGVTDWGALRTLHGALVSVSPTLGARVAWAAAIGRTDGADAGIAALDAITDGAVRRFQPALATRAHLLAMAARTDEAVVAFERAIALTTDGAAERYLRRRRDALLRDAR